MGKREGADLCSPTWVPSGNGLWFRLLAYFENMYFQWEIVPMNVGIGFSLDDMDYIEFETNTGKFFCVEGNRYSLVTEMRNSVLLLFSRSC